MNKADIIGLIREFGFPTFVVLWFMLRVEKRLDRGAELQSAQLTATGLLAKSVDYILMKEKSVEARPLPLPAPEPSSATVIQKEGAA